MLIFSYSYVDSSRMIAVQMSGADDDLKGLITASGIRGRLDVIFFMFFWQVST